MTGVYESPRHSYTVPKTCPACGQLVTDAPLTVRQEGNKVIINGVPYKTSATRADIIMAIATRYPDVARFDDICRDVYGSLVWPEPKTLSVHIYGIRRQFERAPFDIENVWGRGYKLVLRGTGRLGVS